MNNLLGYPYKILLLVPLLVGGSACAEIGGYEPEGYETEGYEVATGVMRDAALDEISLGEESTLPLLSTSALQDLVAPIALYPDDLLGIVLPAATYPIQIVQAARFLETRGNNDKREAPSAWDDSVVALLNYPEVITLLNEDLDWTWKLGEAVMGQHEDVLIAVANFRELARTAGNLESDSRQTVEVLDDGIIEIRPANPEVIYVPYYEPSRVIYYSSRPVYHYYPSAYPVYYYPYPAGYAFTGSYFWGITSSFSIGWRTHHLHVHHYGFADHPYADRTYSYGHHNYRRPKVSRSYTQNYKTYSKSGRDKRAKRHHAGNYWQPKHQRSGPRPRLGRAYNPEPAHSGSQRSRDRAAKSRVAKPRVARQIENFSNTQKMPRSTRLERIQKDDRREQKHSRVVRTERLSKETKRSPRVRSYTSPVNEPAKLTTRKLSPRPSSTQGPRAQPRTQPRAIAAEQRRAPAVSRRTVAASPAPVQSKARARPASAVAEALPAREAADKPKIKKKARKEARKSIKDGKRNYREP